MLYILQIPAESVDVERQNARYFMNALLAFLPSLLPLRSSIEVDQALQDFASKYCQGKAVVALCPVVSQFVHLQLLPTH